MRQELDPDAPSRRPIQQSKLNENRAIPAMRATATPAAGNEASNNRRVTSCGTKIRPRAVTPSTTADTESKSVFQFALSIGDRFSLRHHTCVKRGNNIDGMSAIGSKADIRKA